ncbi:MAG: nucleotidyl transferase AbiEii/AbiGii toxin family protein, partial [Nanoarchaeota archaeon]
FLDRFSVDLDFDLLGDIDEKIFRFNINKITKRLGLVDENKNKESLFFNFKYKAPQNQRNKLKFSFFQNVVASNVYEPRLLPEINRTVNCQTIETMFANKLVAVIDR